MTREIQILEALKREPNPYNHDVQRRIAEEFRDRVYDVSKVAKDHSLILDRIIDERKNAPKSAIPDRAAILPTLKEIAKQANSVRLEITDREHRSEMEDLAIALKTLGQITPGYLRSLPSSPTTDRNGKNLESVK